MLLDASESQLVLVDYQERLMPAIFEGPAALANALRLAQIAQLMEVPVWGTEQNPSRLGGNDPALRALCQKTLAKMHFSAADEGLGEWLRPPAKPQQGGNARSLPKHLQKPQTARVGQHGRRIVNGRHQAGLIVDQHQLAIVGVEQHGVSGKTGIRRFAAAKANGLQPLKQDTVR